MAKSTAKDSNDVAFSCVVERNDGMPRRGRPTLPKLLSTSEDATMNGQLQVFVPARGDLWPSMTRNMTRAPSGEFHA